jgi:Ni/Fe-hydrogenase subunit HybB-like protein
VDLARRHALHLLLQPRPETYLFALEILLLVVPMFLLFRRSIHTNRTYLYLCSVLTLLGIVANRMNVAITGMLASSGNNYFPKWTEISITLAIIACGFLVFALAVKYLPIFSSLSSHEPVAEPETVKGEFPELSSVES